MRPAIIGIVPPACENSHRISRHRAKPPESRRLVTHRVVSCGTSMTAGNVPTLTRLEADAVRLQGLERVFNFLERPIDVDHRQRREQAKAAGLLAHPFGGIVVT